MAELKKTDPMALKLFNHVEAFRKAMEDNDSNTALSHLDEIQKHADFLASDIHTALRKQETAISGPNDMFAGGAPVWKFNEAQNTVSNKNSSVLPGHIAHVRQGGLRKFQGRGWRN
jgi:hypothetical protein